MIEKKGGKIEEFNKKGGRYYMIYYNICSFIIIGLEHILLEVCERRIEDHILQAALILVICLLAVIAICVFMF